MTGRPQMGSRALPGRRSDVNRAGMSAPIFTKKTGQYYEVNFAFELPRSEYKFGTVVVGSVPLCGGSHPRIQPSEAGGHFHKVAHIRQNRTPSVREAARKLSRFDDTQASERYSDRRPTTIKRPIGPLVG